MTIGTVCMLFHGATDLSHCLGVHDSEESALAGHATGTPATCHRMRAISPSSWSGCTIGVGDAEVKQRCSVALFRCPNCGAQDDVGGKWEDCWEPSDQAAPGVCHCCGRAMPVVMLAHPFVEEGIDDEPQGELPWCAACYRETSQQV